jgi:hypothetical protein
MQAYFLLGQMSVQVPVIHSPVWQLQVTVGATVWVQSAKPESAEPPAAHIASRPLSCWIVSLDSFSFLPLFLIRPPWGYRGSVPRLAHSNPVADRPSSPPPATVFHRWKELHSRITTIKIASPIQKILNVPVLPPWPRGAASGTCW